MITLTEYAARRKKIIKMIGQESIAIFFASPLAIRSGDSTYTYRQHSDFYYLTGFEEPEAVVILAPKRKEGEFILFNRSRNREEEIWTGYRAGQQGAMKQFRADQAFSIEELELQLPLLLQGRKTIHYAFGLHTPFDHLILKAVDKVRSKARAGLHFPTEFVDTASSIHEMRLIKSKDEIATLQKAVDITSEAHIRAMQCCQPGMYEYELQAEIEYIFLKNGARAPAYNTIVGSGANTCILHYVDNTKRIEPNDLVLIDAGAEYQNYAADITRTFPANGRFTGEKRAIYALVLAAQKAGIQAIKPGAKWDVVQEAIVKQLTEGLIDLKILTGSLDGLIEKQAYLPFYMHKSGHWLGLDVHDAGRYRIDGQWRKFTPGMVLTVEPGLYFPSDSKNIPKGFHSIGVRIEDNILVTDKGRKVLSASIPKEISDIEKHMGQ